MNPKNLKPFNLQAALKGEPVMLRDGRKAYVRHHETEVVVVEGWQLLGVIIRNGNNSSVMAWTKSGDYIMDGDESGLDIIGMWPKTRMINGFEVPAPETVNPIDYSKWFLVDLTSQEFFDRRTWTTDIYNCRLLRRGLVFLNAEDAIANAKAMLGIDPYGEANK